MSDNSENLAGDPFSEKFWIVRQFRQWLQQNITEIKIQNITEIKIQKQNITEIKFWNWKSKFEKTKKLSYNKIKRKGFQKLENLRLSP